MLTSSQNGRIHETEICYIFDLCAVSLTTLVSYIASAIQRETSCRSYAISFKQKFNNLQEICYIVLIQYSKDPIPSASSHPVSIVSVQNIEKKNIQTRRQSKDRHNQQKAHTLTKRIGSWYLASLSHHPSAVTLSHTHPIVL